MQWLHISTVIHMTAICYILGWPVEGSPVSSTQHTHSRHTQQINTKISNETKNFDEQIENLQKQSTSQSEFVLVRATPLTERHLLFLKSLRKILGPRDWIQFWRHPDVVGRFCDFWIFRKYFKNYLAELFGVLDIHYEIIDKQITGGNFGSSSFTMNNIETFDEMYHPWDELVSEMMRLVTVYDKLVSVDVIGTSAEGRPIHAIHVNTHMDKTKPIIFLNCGSHAREWLAVASCQYFLRRLVFDQLYNDDVIKILRNYQITMVPLLNPDGYVYTREEPTITRLWRKNRSNPQGQPGGCIGVDLNRNFNYRWSLSGTSENPCSDVYCGPKPFSERESLAFGKYVYRLRRNIAAFLDVHTFGQIWMGPWSSSKKFSPHYARQEAAMKKVHEAISQETGQLYRYGRSSVVLYQHSGTSIDWVYGTFGLVHTYGVELRPWAGPSPFVVPSKDIVPTGKDLWAGFRAMGRHMIQENNL